MDEVSLRIQGQTFEGWREVRINPSIEQLAGTFELTVTDHWTLTGDAQQLAEGQACQVLIAGTPVITGWIDELEPMLEADQHGLTIRGRDKAGDLVDCSALHAGQEWSGRRLDQIAADLCAPFGIGVQVRTDVGGAFAHTHIDEGETVYEVLERAARMRGVLLISDPATGDLVITRAGAGRTTAPIIQGENLIGGSGNRSTRDRYSLYRVTGQQRETNWLQPEAAAAPVAIERDAGIGRYRPLVLSADGSAGIGDCRTRARWERSVRIAKSERAYVRVLGWLDGDTPWRINQRVPVRAPWLRLDGQYLAAAVEYVLNDDEGQLTEITVVPPQAFDVRREAEPAPASASGGLFG